MPKHAVLLGGGNILGQCISRMLVLDHGYTVTSISRTPIRQLDWQHVHPQCEESIKHLIAPWQCGQFPSVESIRKAGFLPKKVDCIIHNYGTLFQEDYSFTGFSELADNMKRTLLKRLQPDSPLYKYVTRLILAPGDRPQDNKYCGYIQYLPVHTFLFERENQQSALKELRAFVEGHAATPSAQGSVPDEPATFAYVSPDQLFAPFREAGKKVDMQATEEAMLQICSKSTVTGSKDEVATMQNAPQGKVVRPLIIQPSHLWDFKLDDRRQCTDELHGTLPPPLTARTILQCLMEASRLHADSGPLRDSDCKDVLEALSKLVDPVPLSAEGVAEAIVRAIADPGTSGILDNRKMSGLAMRVPAAEWNYEYLDINASDLRSSIDRIRGTENVSCQ